MSCSAWFQHQNPGCAGDHRARCAADGRGGETSGGNSQGYYPQMARLRWVKSENFPIDGSIILKYPITIETHTAILRYSQWCNDGLPVPILTSHANRCSQCHMWVHSCDDIELVWSFGQHLHFTEIETQNLNDSETSKTTHINFVEFQSQICFCLLAMGVGWHDGATVYPALLPGVDPAEQRRGLQCSLE